MDTLAPPPAVNLLSLQNVPTLPKLDKTHIIDSYLQGQKAHARAYATEGQALFSSWGRRCSIPDTESDLPPVQAQHYGFGTPVLKPRVAKLREDPLPAAITEGRDQRRKSHKSLLQKLVPQRCSEIEVKPKQSEQWSNDKRMSRTIAPPSDSMAKPLSKKRAISSDPDEGRAARLVERRERKRTKRAMLQPASDNQSDYEATVAENGKPKAKKWKDLRAATGFALMHGFTATNVGMNRLTLKPPHTVGVFNKGKASAKTQVTRKKASVKKGRGSNGFSELGFLNRTRKETPKKRQKKHSSLSFGSAGTRANSNSRSPHITPKKFLITNKDLLKLQKSKKETDVKAEQAEHSENERDSDLSTQEHSSVAAPQHKAAIAESKIWDIELEDPVSTVEVASTPANINIRQGSIILDIRPLRWADGLDLPAEQLIHYNNGEAAATASKSVVRAVDVHSSPSLGPSQSASQRGQALDLRLNPPPIVRAVSKYFLHAVTEPVNEMLVATDSLPEPARDTPRNARNGADASNNTNLARAITPEQISPSALFPDIVVNQLIKETHLVSSPSQKLPHFTHPSPTSPFQLGLQAYVTEESRMDIDGDRGSFTTGIGECDPSSEATFSTGYGGCVELDCYDDPYPHLRDDRCGGQHGDRFEDAELDEPCDEEKCDLRYDWQECDDMLGHHVYATKEDPASYVEDHLEGWEEDGNEQEDNLASFEYLDGDEEQYPNNVQCSGYYRFGRHGDEDQELEAIDIGVVSRDPELKTLGGSGRESYQLDHGMDNYASNSTSDIADSENGSVIFSQRFAQGRALLLGFGGQHDNLPSPSRTFNLVSRAEADVVKSLRGHWLPQRL